MANEKRGLIKQIRERQLGFLGHVLRRKQLEHLSLSGKIEGRRARGRQRHKYLDTLLQDIHQQITPGALIQLADNRNGWRELTVNVRDMTPR